MNAPRTEPTPPGAVHRLIRHAWRRVLAGAALSVLLALMGFGMFQNKLLYFPAPANVAAMTAGGLSAWPAADDFRGLLAEPHGPARATLLLFHGNAGHAGHRQFYVDALTNQGLRVILAEYPGYGPRGGDLGENSLVADAEQAIVRARAQFAGPLLIAGESLGAGVATAAVDRQRAAVAGLMLITPWDRLRHVASHHYPLLPVGLLLRDDYDSIGHLLDFQRPQLVVVASDDEIIPPAFGKALHAALGEPKRLSIIDGAGHNDWFDRVNAAWWRQAIDFLLGDRHDSGNPAIVKQSS
jgi:hypothetical protein